MPTNDVLESLVSIANNLNRRVRALESQLAVRASQDWAGYSFWFRVAPNTPPNDALVVSAGTFWNIALGAGSSDGIVVPEQSADFSAGGNCEAGAFADPVGSPYRGALLWIDDAGVLDTDESADVATTGLAETAAAGLLVTGRTDAFLPLALLILRSNGTAGAGQVEPIQIGRNATASYIYIRDVRPWLHTHVTS